MADSKEKLFSDFPPVSTQEWMDKIQVDLKGADYEKKLVWKTNEGFKVKPFYRQEDLEGLKTTDGLPGQYPYLRGIKKDDNTWFIRQDIRVDDPAEANAKALDILNKGIDSLGFHVPAKALDADFIRTLLKDICCECIELNFTTCQRHTLQLAELLVAYFKEKGYDPEKIQGSVNFDPISKMLQKGKDLSGIVAKGAELVKVLAPFPKFRCIAVNSLKLNNAGAYIYQELGYALAWGNYYLNALVEAGIPVDLAARKIKFNFGISSNYFMEIAKFRAARMLWADIVKAYGPTEECACKMVAHAETSTFNLTLFDAHVNLLRTQTEAMSAAIAGVNSITVTPFDKVYETPNEFSERIARNQQLLLKEEAHLNRIVDAAGGSYYIENLTVAIAQQAWNLFLETEDAGGMLAAIQQGTVQDTVNASNKARHEAVSKRKEILLGTNQYPNFSERAEGKMPVSCCCGCGGHENEAAFASLNTDRAASEFEALRLQTEHSGKRPKAFMLTIGNLAMRQARAQFSCNFLACAGYEVIDNLGFATVEEGAEAALKAQADIVVICSSDDEYAQYAVPAYELLKDKVLFIVAGAPACMEELKAAGIENFIHVRCNVLETLKSYNEKLGIK
ncbi:methylmalonyl-CoA mutase small subunit [Phocaeicola barnesiae]|uniref:Methylmalonyl-CoA mutase small subunit n=2 Tax=Phocaeicola barnesiae TaxID=376804 RepID=A0AAW5N6M0_9BACT|nr:methylmalonyl-CoA mutase small subunit [Phocaeicola barnesiae]MCR8873139.1 methylmalonyl-CoA mutase small subunit [Phocaeicola barnesiae]MDM8253646.1 methylmalonyl-CoA mutase small subunit [Phocaeicola barnesiae]MDM8256939.1 methylmalonyl-CoA mutase small subunit [Phocaeicola barnesiae]MDM8307979.1 methylmalonyl-CoA mutase small subunit [Phocaeicola barnesiae]